MEVGSTVQSSNNDLDLERGGITTTTTTKLATGGIQSLIPKLDNTTMMTVGGVAAATSIASFLVADPMVVDAASLLTTGFAPYVIHQQYQLAKMVTMESLQNTLREKANLLAAERIKLTERIVGLEKNVNRLKNVEKDFGELCVKSKTNANVLISLVKETTKIQNDMEQILKEKLVQDVLQNIIRTDTSGDFVIGDNEMEILIMRMSMQPGIEFQQERFRKKLAMTNDRSIKTIMKMFRNLLDGNPDDDDQLFSFDMKHQMLSV